MATNDDEFDLDADEDFFLFAGPRSVFLHKQAYAEEGLQCRNSDERVAPTSLLYPRSWVDSVNQMSGEKKYDYSFIGTLYRPETYPQRSWILDFAKRRFTDRSYFLLSEDSPEHELLGSFDRTGRDTDTFVPKNVPWLERDHFNAAFYRILRASEFSLCPEGDAPWSMRFFEAILCRSIPIVSSLRHTGRNKVELSIGYKVFFPDDEHVYDSDIAEYNYRLFIEHQTLIAADDHK
jgi:hypothetical protein